MLYVPKTIKEVLLLMSRISGFAGVCLLVLLPLAGCGGGAGAETGGGGGSVNGADFALQVNPAALELAPGTSETLHISYTPVGNFTGTVAVSASNVPSGVTLSPSAPMNIAAAGTFVTISVSPSTAVSMYSVSFQGTSGGLSHFTDLALDVSSSIGLSPAGGSSFLPLGQQPFAAVFDPVHKQVFASLPWLDAVDVISTTGHRLIKRIPVPAPKGMDLTLDDSQLLVGTDTNQLYTIDTTQLAVVSKTTLPPIMNSGTPEYIQPEWPLAAANGTILIVGAGDFPVGVFQWDPSTQTLTPRRDADVSGDSRAARDADGSKILFYDPGDGGESIYDAATDTFVHLPSLAPSYLFPVGGAINPAGTQVAIDFGGGPVMVTDASGNVLQELDLGGSFGVRYSTDGQHLLSVSDVAPSFEVVTVDANTFNLVGTAPAYSSGSYGATVVYPWDPDLCPEIPLAVDDAGFVYGAADHGLAIDNSQAFETLDPNANVPVFVQTNPLEGGVGLATSVSVRIGMGAVSTSQAPTVFVGSQQASGVAASEPFSMQFTAPASDVPGPETVQIQQDGGVNTYLPLAFSYGPTLIPEVIQAVPPSGGVTADLWGYGLGIDLTNANTVAEVGGQSAPVTFSTVGINPPGAGGNAYPFPVQHLQIAVPAGQPGTSADALVVSPVGAASLAGGIQYLKDATIVPSSDPLSALTYDSKRQRLYLSAGDHVDVVDLASDSFIAPIALPALHGGKLAAGITLTPDDSRLLVSNTADGSIAVIDPDNPTAAVAVSIPYPPPPAGVQCTEGPGQIVATDTGKAYANTVAGGIDSCPGLPGVVELDLSSLTARLVTYTTDPTSPIAYVPAAELVSAQSGRSIAVTDRNNLYVLDAASDKWSSRQLDSNSNLYDFAQSADGSLTVLRTISYGEGIMGFPIGEPYRDRYVGVDESMSVTASLISSELDQYFSGSYSPGMQLHDSGSLIYAMQSKEIDIYDLHHGDERERVLLPEDRVAETGSEILTETAIDETGSRIFLITKSGVTVITLDSVPLSLGTVAPSSGSSGGGVQLTLHGSGFESGATVSIGGVVAPTTFIDSTALQVTTPPSNRGGLAITVQNPDGQTYALDDAYTAN